MNWTERFQVTIPAKTEAGESWKEPESARESYPQEKLQMPPGYDASGPCDSFQSVSGSPGDVTDKALNLEGEAQIQKGYGKARMKGTDDMYTGEHADQFYGDAGGFVERNNYLDRE